MLTSITEILSQSSSEWVDELMTEQSWAYYSLTCLFFVLSGLAVGYFIWRKGHMQTQDVELEVQLTRKELDAMESDLRLEKKVLDP